MSLAWRADLGIAGGGDSPDAIYGTRAGWVIRAAQPPESILAHDLVLTAKSCHDIPRFPCRPERRLAHP